MVHQKSGPSLAYKEPYECEQITSIAYAYGIFGQLLDTTSVFRVPRLHFEHTIRKSHSPVGVFLTQTITARVQDLFRLIYTTIARVYPIHFNVEYSDAYQVSFE